VGGNERKRVERMFSSSSFFSTSFDMFFFLF